MGKSAASAMTFETMPDTKPKRITHKAAAKLTNDMTLLSTPEILRRLYKRHQTGVWQTIAVVIAASWIATIFN